MDRQCDLVACTRLIILNDWRSCGRKELPLSGHILASLFEKLMKKVLSCLVFVRTDGRTAVQTGGQIDQQKDKGILLAAYRNFLSRHVKHFHQKPDGGTIATESAEVTKMRLQIRNSGFVPNSKKGLGREKPIILTSKFALKNLFGS